MTKLTYRTYNSSNAEYWNISNNKKNGVICIFGIKDDLPKIHVSVSFDIKDSDIEDILEQLGIYRCFVSVIKPENNYCFELDR